jgi:exodeoxyribonuclease X
MKLFVIDTETSDLEPSKGATILELAWVVLSDEYGSWKPINYCSSYIQYSGPIHPRAQASHHIRADKLTSENGAIVRAEAVGWLLKNLGQDSIPVAHNVEFDSKFLPEISRPWICTLRSAKHIWPDAPGYGNQVLRYWLNVEFTRELLDVAPIINHLHPHQALYDAATTSGILLKMLEKGYTTEQLLGATGTPILLKTINFGKHKGMDFNTVPRDYLIWLRGQSNLDPDVRATIDSILR